jgi:hypothetical protein
MEQKSGLQKNPISLAPQQLSETRPSARKPGCDQDLVSQAASPDDWGRDTREALDFDVTGDVLVDMGVTLLRMSRDPASRCACSWRRRAATSRSCGSCARHTGSARRNPSGRCRHSRAPPSARGRLGDNRIRGTC